MTGSLKCRKNKDKKNENLPKLGTKHNRKIEHITILTLKLTEGQNYKIQKTIINCIVKEYLTICRFTFGKLDDKAWKKFQ
jgi:hypothetical protein